MRKVIFTAMAVTLALLIGLFMAGSVCAAENVASDGSDPPEHYVVKPKDTLSHIALRYGMKWPELWKLNKDTVRNPHLIFPKQRLRVSADLLPRETIAEKEKAIESRIEDALTDVTPRTNAPELMTDANASLPASDARDRSALPTESESCISLWWRTVKRFFQSAFTAKDTKTTVPALSPEKERVEPRAPPVAMPPAMTETLPPVVSTEGTKEFRKSSPARGPRVDVSRRSAAKSADETFLWKRIGGDPCKLTPLEGIKRLLYPPHVERALIEKVRKEEFTWKRLSPGERYLAMCFDKRMQKNVVNALPDRKDPYWAKTYTVIADGKEWKTVIPVECGNVARPPETPVVPAVPVLPATPKDEALPPPAAPVPPDAGTLLPPPEKEAPDLPQVLIPEKPTPPATVIPPVKAPRKSCGVCPPLIVVVPFSVLDEEDRNVRMLTWGDPPKPVTWGISKRPVLIGDPPLGE